ncbi:MAG TPA: A/G-specific adenine glycosylase [Candidatus Saccharimonadales bacterium]|nr:A/G-specific adenine glycosylase [Candidatus Saccharimonadales bacterium]
MVPADQLAEFRKELLGWFRQFQRELPWRQSKDPYRIWLSEIMLQQTRVAAAIPYYERFLLQFPDIHSLAEAPADEVLRLWSGLGYYSRAHNLQQAAQWIVAMHAGVFPSTYADTLALPGIGAYTAAAILSIAFGAKHAVLDGNVARVVARIGAIRGDLRQGRRWQSLQIFADNLLDEKAPGDWNQAMMELGATICTPRSPQCLLCPVSRFCEARKLGAQEKIPEKRKKRATVEITLAAAVLVDLEGQTLLLSPPGESSTKAPADEVAKLVSQMWHFPTVSVKKNAQAELQQFLSRLFPGKKSKSFRLKRLRKAKHSVTYRDITIFPFRIALKKLPEAASGQSAVKVVPLSGVSSLAVSNLTRKVARAAEQFHGQSLETRSDRH